MLLIGFPLILAGGMGIGFLLWAFIYYLISQSLQAHGQVIFAKISEKQYGGVQELAGQMSGYFAENFIKYLGKITPIHHVNFEYQHSIKKKTIVTQQNLFTDEEVLTNSEGQIIVLLHPKFGRFIHWAVTREM